LRGTVIHLSVATGMPDTPNLTTIAAAADPSGALRLAGGGAALEAGARECTLRFAARLDALHIPYTISYEPTGTHSWPDFAKQLPSTWAAIAQAFGEPCTVGSGAAGPDPERDM
jgi:S-formylglutathione hydrolase FrmB